MSDTTFDSSLLADIFPPPSNITQTGRFTVQEDACSAPCGTKCGAGCGGGCGARNAL